MPSSPCFDRHWSLRPTALPARHRRSQNAPDVPLARVQTYNQFLAPSAASLVPSGLKATTFGSSCSINNTSLPALAWYVIDAYVTVPAGGCEPLVIGAHRKASGAVVVRCCGRCHRPDVFLPAASTTREGRRRKPRTACRACRPTSRRTARHQDHRSFAPFASWVRRPERNLLYGAAAWRWSDHLLQMRCEVPHCASSSFCTACAPSGEKIVIVPSSWQAATAPALFQASDSTEASSGVSFRFSPVDAGSHILSSRRPAPAATHFPSGDTATFDSCAGASA